MKRREPLMMTHKRTHRAAALALALVACGPTPEPKPVTASVRTDGPQAQSVEWLYATPGSSGVVKDECKLVIQVLEGEQKCSGDLCQHAITLAEDWLSTCRVFESAEVPRVQKLLATFQSRAKVSGGECAFQGKQLIDKGCPEAADCPLVAQTWATKCSKHTSPLVVQMIEKQVERNTGTPITLDTTSCKEMFAKVTESTDCGNDFECEEKLDMLKQYQARCVQAGAPLPLDHAVKQALLIESAKQQPPPFLVKEPKFPPERGRLLLDDSTGFVVAVGEQPAPNVNLLIKTLRESEYTLPIRLVRVFSHQPNRYELRVGSIEAPDPETFFRRFRSLELTGQSEALGSHYANAAIERLNEVVKILDRQQDALAGLVATLTYAHEVQADREFQAEFAKADKHLARVFERLGRAKRAKLPPAYVQREQMRDRVAFARRTWQEPFADVTREGRIQLGAITPAVLADVETLLPVSFQAYRESMDGTVGKALRKLEQEYERDLRDEARRLADACVAQLSAANQHERELLSCAFRVRQCKGDEVEKTNSLLDQTITAYESARAELEVQLLELEEPPGGELAQKVRACRD